MTYYSLRGLLPAALAVALLLSPPCRAAKPVKLTTEQTLIWRVAFSPDGKLLASGHVEEGIKLREVATGKLVHVFEDFERQFSYFAFTPDGKGLVTLDQHGPKFTVKVWNLTTYKPRLTFEIKERGAVALTPDGKTLIVGGTKVAATLYDLATGKEVAELKPPVGMIREFVLSPDGKTLAARVSKGPVVLWDLPNRKQMYAIEDVLRWTTGYTESFAFSPDGKRLAIGGAGSDLMVWDVNKAEQVGSMKPLQDALESIHGINRLAYTQDGKRLVLAGAGISCLLLWDAEDWKPIPEFSGKGHGGKNLPKGYVSSTIWHMALSPDGTTLATVGFEDKTILLWKLPPPKPRE